VARLFTNARHPVLLRLASYLSLETGTMIRLIILLPGKSQDSICCTITNVGPYTMQYEASIVTWLRKMIPIARLNVSISLMG
jgi:hypothetical protein